MFRDKTNGGRSASAAPQSHLQPVMYPSCAGLISALWRHGERRSNPSPRSRGSSPVPTIFARDHASLASLATTPIARADRVGLSRRLTEVNVIQFASSFAVGAGRIDGNGTGSSGGVIGGSKLATSPSARLSSSPWVRCSETCACVGSVSILEAGMFAAELVCVLRIVAASARMAPSVATSWIMSLASPLALLGKTRCKSPISSGFKFHSVSSVARPDDNLLPCGSPLWR